jgi:uncharacterized protein YndB with AHSA1/START domain
VPERVRGYASRIDVRAPPALVWRALVDPQLLKLWCAVDARVTPQVDGRYWTLLDGGVEREALIDIFEPEHRLRLIYMPTPGMPAADEVIVDDFLLAVEKGETAVRLLGSGVPVGGPWDNYFLKLRGSWERALARLKVGCERFTRDGAPPPAPARSTTRR